MQRQEHWETVYQTKDHTKVGWYQPSCDTLLELIQKIGLSKEVSVIDIGAGASTFVDGLIEYGFKNITLLDLSNEALTITKKRLKDKAHIPNYLVEDITAVSLPQRYDLWHDRAAFHFLLDENEQQSYIQTMCNSLNPQGYAIIGTFAVDGPDSCSALSIQQYNRERMEEVMDGRIAIIDVIENIHITPSGGEQKFSFFILKLI
ncbi:MAG: class I SAM-dependent methyltransferase [Sulfuricurvum sp.]|nr:class I SAM-dependent methyltransferase [Sulfuricurvum sp.]MDP3120882.1 class I SAM-dependent methyltransferase [Sulfuricurvum sp.]